MHCAYPLKSRFHAIAKERSISVLFHDILKIQNAGVIDFLPELQWIQRLDSPSYSLAIDVYEELNRRRRRIDGSTMNEIR